MVEQRVDAFRRIRPTPPRDGPARRVLGPVLRGGLGGALALGVLGGLAWGPELSDRFLAMLSGAASGLVGGAFLALAGCWLAGPPTLDPSLLGRRPVLRCPCGTNVLFTLLQAGASVECPACGRKVPVPSLSRLRNSDWSPPPG
jgi:hypothetical protein